MLFLTSGTVPGTKGQPSTEPDDQGGLAVEVSIARDGPGKYIHLLRKVLEKIRNGTFGELDVLALFILARDPSPRDSALREFGDFIQDLPLTTESFQRGLLSDNRVFTLARIQQGLEDVCRQVAVDPLDQDRVNVVILMLIPILQGSVFEGICRLMVAVTHRDIGIVGFVEGEHGSGIVPVLAVPNQWYEVPIRDPRFLGFVPDEELEVESIDGRVVLRGLGIEQEAAP